MFGEEPLIFFEFFCFIFDFLILINKKDPAPRKKYRTCANVCSDMLKIAPEGS
jgi:hypothetical protein